MFQGPDYSIEDQFKIVLDKVLSEIPDKTYLKELPLSIINKIIAHTDKTHFVFDYNCELNIPDVAGPYTVYDESRVFLFRVNLHSSTFGETLVEKAYINVMRPGESIYLNYVTADNEIRDIQIMKL